MLALCARSNLDSSNGADHDEGGTWKTRSMELSWNTMLGRHERQLPRCSRCRRMTEASLGVACTSTGSRPSVRPHVRWASRRQCGKKTGTAFLCAGFQDLWIGAPGFMQHAHPHLASRVRVLVRHEGSQRSQLPPANQTPDSPRNELPAKQLEQLGLLELVP
jgi:hypothetical protein